MSLKMTPRDIHRICGKLREDRLLKMYSGEKGRRTVGLLRVTVHIPKGNTNGGTQTGSETCTENILLSGLQRIC